MATIGNLGKLIVFEVSSKKIQTFESMKQTVKGRWATHAVIGGKPISEFLGSDLSSITLTIMLSVNHGVRPRATIEKIEKAVESGTPYPLVIGGKQVGKYQWKITSMSESWDKVIRDGALVEAKLTLTLEEYL